MSYEEELASLIDIVVTEGGSDLHFSVGSHPTIRVSGELIPLLKKDPHTKEDMDGFITALLSEKQKQEFLTVQEIDFSYNYRENLRFRGNAFFQKGVIGVALRLIPQEIKTIEELNLPPILESFAHREQGFFLVVGPVGQGKSTTLASMIQLINQTRAEHIVTIEDPIEFIFSQDKSLIDQREVKIDNSFPGDQQDQIRIQLAGSLAGIFSQRLISRISGGLIPAYELLINNNAAQTIDRIIDSFPGDQQDQIRIQLAGSLAGIFSQRLISRISGGLIPAYELLINNNAVSNLIREKRTHEINTVIETGAEEGMIDMNRSLADLVRRGEISVDSAMAESFNPDNLKNLV